MPRTRKLRNLPQHLAEQRTRLEEQANGKDEEAINQEALQHYWELYKSVRDKFQDAKFDLWDELTRPTQLLVGRCLVLFGRYNMAIARLADEPWKRSVSQLLQDFGPRIMSSEKFWQLFTIWLDELKQRTGDGKVTWEQVMKCMTLASQKRKQTPVNGVNTKRKWAPCDIKEAQKILRDSLKDTAETDARVVEGDGDGDDHVDQATKTATHGPEKRPNQQQQLNHDDDAQRPTSTRNSSPPRSTSPPVQQHQESEQQQQGESSEAWPEASAISPEVPQWVNQRKRRTTAPTATTTATTTQPGPPVCTPTSSTGHPQSQLSHPLDPRHQSIPSKRLRSISPSAHYHHHSRSRSRCRLRSQSARPTKRACLSPSPSSSPAYLSTVVEVTEHPSLQESYGSPELGRHAPPPLRDDPSLPDLTKEKSLDLDLSDSDHDDYEDDYHYDDDDDDDDAEEESPAQEENDHDKDGLDDVSWSEEMVSDQNTVILVDDESLAPSSSSLSSIDATLRCLAPGQECTYTCIETLMTTLFLLPTVQLITVGPVAEDGWERWANVRKPYKIREAANMILVFLERPTRRHWTLLAFDSRRRHISFSDSAYNSADLGKVKAIVESLAVSLRFDIRNWRFEKLPTPQQPNNFDCGLYAVVMAAHLVANAPPPLSIDGCVWRCVLRHVLQARQPNAAPSVLGPSRRLILQELLPPLSTPQPARLQHDACPETAAVKCTQQLRSCKKVLGSLQQASQLFAILREDALDAATAATASRVNNEASTRHSYLTNVVEVTSAFYIAPPDPALHLPSSFNVAYNNLLAAKAAFASCAASSLSNMKRDDVAEMLHHARSVVNSMRSIVQADETIKQIELQQAKNDLDREIQEQDLKTTRLKNARANLLL